MTHSHSISRTLSRLASPERYLFTLGDLSSLVPGHSLSAFKTLINRLAADGTLERVCKGLYLYPGVSYPRDLVLYHAAARLRANAFCYLSLESVLSDAGVISQIPMQWITLMTSGRSGCIRCGSFGTIEFIHTRKQADRVAPELSYDLRIRLWRASVKQAMADMKDTRRNQDLIDQEALHELV